MNQIEHISDNVLCLDTMYIAHRTVMYRVIYRDGSEYTYTRKIHILEYVLFDLDTLVSYYHILGCMDYGNIY